MERRLKNKLIIFGLGVAWLYSIALGDLVMYIDMDLTLIPHLPSLRMMSTYLFVNILIPVALCIGSIWCYFRFKGVAKNKVAVAGILIAGIGLASVLKLSMAFFPAFGQALALKTSIDDDFELQGLCETCATTSDCEDYCGEICRYNEEKYGYPGKLLEHEGERIEEYNATGCYCTCGR